MLFLESTVLTYLQELAEIMALQNNETAEQAITKLKNQEQAKQMFAHLRRVMQPQERRGLAMIKIPIEDGNNDGPKWETVVDTQRIEEILLERNQKHYGQARGTPFTTGELGELVGISGTTTESDRVIDGDYNTDHLLPAASAILQELRRGRHLPAIDSQISFEQYKNGWER